MGDHLGDKDAEKTWQMQEADAAHKRNVVLLNAIEAAGEKLQSREHLLLHPDTVNLETRYWAKVEESIPKWEPFFLGRTQAPVGIKKIKLTKQNKNPSKGSLPRWAVSIHSLAEKRGIRRLEGNSGRVAARLTKLSGGVMRARERSKCSEEISSMMNSQQREQTHYHHVFLIKRLEGVGCVNLTYLPQCQGVCTAHYCAPG
ncbi:uncharacterized protein C3orf14 homolog isoform X2 [Hemicordylus capensis]|nr:uncharacterized protein C3orf14 homolog isoform X2 [Hemicordylus capensis]